MLHPILLLRNFLFFFFFVVGPIAYGGPARSPCVHPFLFLRTSFVGHLVCVGEARSLRFAGSAGPRPEMISFWVLKRRGDLEIRGRPLGVAPLWC